MTVAARCRVSIIIKALNEEANIAAAVESSLRAVAPIGGEVILADSCSTDRTVAVASAYPVRVVQLAQPEHRRCGAGPQLGYQHARGEYVYILDGDMQMVPGFLERALAFLAQHPEVGGVAGRVVERNLDSLEYRERARRAAAHPMVGAMDRLEGGGLYRRRAIEEAGYFSDRNLHSYEEFDLASRLRARGWKLWRLPVDAATHYGHDAPPYRLLRRRWQTGYICGLGELVRGALGQPHQRAVLRGVRELKIYLGVLVGWLLLASVPFWPLPGAARAGLFVALALAPVAAMALRKRSLAAGVYAIASWCVNAAGLVRGFVQPRTPPREPLPSRVLHEPGDARHRPPDGTGRGPAARPQNNNSPNRQNNV